MRESWDPGGNVSTFDMESPEFFVGITGFLT